MTRAIGGSKCRSAYTATTGTPSYLTNQTVHETMSNGSGQDPDTTRASEQPHPASSHGDKPKQSGPVHLKSSPSLERLRERVKEAVHELDRLRKENAALAERIRQLETRPDVDLDGTVLAFEADPDVLREKVEGFIKTIDTYLAKENE